MTAECPARVDVAGGWSDTPPITYERGGAVVNVAIIVDGKVSASEVIFMMLICFCSLCIVCYSCINFSTVLVL